MQAKLKDRAVTLKLRRSGSLSFLSGLFFDDRGDLMSPSHANKKGVRYRYYVSQAVLQNRTRAHMILRARRRIAEARPDWAPSEAGISSLRGRGPGRGGELEQRPDREDLWEPLDLAESPLDEPLAAELAALDAALASTNRALATRDRTRDPLVYHPGFDEDLRIAEWRRVQDETRALPPLLAAALLWDAWSEIEPLEHLAWLGPLLVSATLRARNKARHHLPHLAAALHLISPPQRRSADAALRLASFLEAVAATADAGAKDHDRWLTARRLLERKLEGKRRNSRMGALVELAMARPIVNAALIARELEITPRAAQTLVAELNLRELTGRGRYRAWGIL